MYRYFYGTIFTFMTLAHMALSIEVLAIDGDYVTPYADNIAAGQCAQGDQECINSRPGAARGGFSDLPIMTKLGGGLLILAIVAAVVWKIRGKKSSTHTPV